MLAQSAFPVRGAGTISLLWLSLALGRGIAWKDSSNGVGEVHMSLDSSFLLLSSSGSAEQPLVRPLLLYCTWAPCGQLGALLWLVQL